MKEIFKRNHKYNKSYIFLFFFILISITVGYAVINTTLNINGSSKFSKNSWSIYFENIVIIDNHAKFVPAAPSIDSDKANISFSAVLAKPGDLYEFNVDIVNNGTLDAMITSISKSGLSAEQQKYIEYSVTYYDGGTISTKDILKAGAKETLRIRVRFISDIEAGDLPNSSDTLNLSYNLNYQQADSTAKTRTKNVICKRATILRTQQCPYTSGSSNCYGAGYSASGTKKTTTITYGQIGTSGTLKTGDAFDCDVIGNGSYNERFYYLSDVDSKTSALIYYLTPNYSGQPTSGLPDQAYDNRYSGSLMSSKYGPVIAKLALPRIDDWPNVRLNNPTVNITDASGNIVVKNFSYSGYAARMLRYSDLANSSCTLNSKTGVLDSCVFLLENTRFGNSTHPTYNIWLENPYEANGPSVYILSASDRAVQADAAYKDNGVKPVIEVPKSAISY